MQGVGSMNKSESITNLAKALTAFQKEIKNPANTAVNPHFKSKYAPLNEILNEVRPVLAKHGLSVLQSPSGDGDKIVITTMLMHETGEWIEACPLVLKADKATAQGAGSAITYGRRYSLASVLGISSEDDDDGNGAEPKPKSRFEPPAQPAKTPPPDPMQGVVTLKLATEPQRKKLFAMSKKAGMEQSDLKLLVEQATGKTSTAGLTEGEIQKCFADLEVIIEAKARREGEETNAQ
jgi:hypothetical protein